MTSSPHPVIRSILKSWGGGLWLLALALLVYFVLSPPPAVNAPGVTWKQVERMWVRDVSGAMQTEHPVAVLLPDSWKPAGLPATGSGRYRLHVELTEESARHALQEPWSLRIDHLHYVHTIWVNGDLLRTSLPRPDWMGLPTPSLIDVTGRMLKTGHNIIEIEIQAAQQGGLSEVALAPKAQLLEDHLMHRFLNRDALIALNLIGIAFSLFVILLWWMRRQESVAGLFGALSLIGYLRNCRYFVTEDLGLAVGAESWLYFVAHVLTGCLQGWFIMALVGRHVQWLHQALWGMLISFPLVGLLALPFDPALLTTRSHLQGGVVLALLPSIWLIGEWAWRDRTRSPLRIGLSIGWLALLVATMHDFTFVRLGGHVSAQQWVTWMIPLVIPSFVFMVMGRVVKAFNEIQDANAHLEGKVAERTKELAAANAAKSHFLASASHDLRQPVAAIGLLADLLRDQVSDSSARGLITRLMAAVRSMESLLKGLLDLSRLDSGTVEVTCHPVRLQALLDAMATHEAESARQKGLQLRVRNTPAIAWTDPILLEQVLRNLVGNAIRHTKKGGVLVGVRSRGDSVSQWEIQVWDTGPGIRPEDQPRIFEAFVQLGNPGRERSQGLGLGLAIVQRAAKLLGHPLRMRSTVGRGSCFSITLPAAEPEAAPMPQKPDANQDIDCANLRVLVVEDDDALRESLALSLHSWGLEAEVGSGMTWLLSQPEKHWDIVITDHRLPDGSGRDVIQHLRKHQPGLPAVIITGDTSPQHLAELAESGLPFLHKPFRSEQLRAMLARSMARSQDRDSRDDSVH